ncbi:MAG: TonB-dependent receptor [Saprospiraceae bacterium]
MQRYFRLLLCCLPFHVFAQSGVQTLKGRVLDQQSQSPLIGVTVTVSSIEPAKGAISDAEGYFVIADVPLGRQVLQCAYIGYEPLVVQNVLLTAGKETMVELSMRESVQSIHEVVVQAVTDQAGAGRNSATVSTLPFNAELTRRFAGSRNDPSRMAANFAGVASNNDARNDIVIRGNSPAGLLWRLEGVDIPNPNHFGSMGSTGGPVSILNNNLLGQCTFLTGAFPAPYGNALSGVFDLQMRKGNPDKREYTGQIGFNGFEIGAEGPLRKATHASYLANYRYSAPALLQNLGFDFGVGSAVPYYQDAAFKLDLPTGGAGRFSVFGIGGLSHIDLLGDLKDTTNFYNNPYQDIHQKTGMGAVGISHVYFWNNSSFTKITVAATGFQSRVGIDSLDASRGKYAQFRDDSWQSRYSASLQWNKKFNAANTLSLGVTANLLGAQLRDSTRVESGDLVSLREFTGQASLMQANGQWQRRFGRRVSINLGIYSQWLDLSHSASAEPRFGLRFEAGSRHSFTLGLGRHSQMQPLGIYLNRRPEDGAQTNRGLDFTYSDQLVLGYEWRFANNWRFQAETYYQSISNVPVDAYASSFSLLNEGADFGLSDRTGLVNKGSGRNYGLELTAERNFDKGYYLLATFSLFDSRYKGSDGVLRNTLFNGGYVANLLAGREYSLGKKLTLALDTRISAAGGKRDTPLDLAQSAVEHRAVYLEDQAYALQLADYFRADVKVTVRLNGRNVMQEWFVDFQNLGNRKNIFSRQYDPQSNVVRTVYQLGFFPNINYRIQF